MTYSAQEAIPSFTNDFRDPSESLVGFLAYNRLTFCIADSVIPCNDLIHRIFNNKCVFQLGIFKYNELVYS